MNNIRLGFNSIILVNGIQKDLLLVILSISFLNPKCKKSSSKIREKISLWLKQLGLSDPQQLLLICIVYWRWGFYLLSILVSVYFRLCFTQQWILVSQPSIKILSQRGCKGFWVQISLNVSKDKNSTFWPILAIIHNLHEYLQASSITGCIIHKNN